MARMYVLSTMGTERSWVSDVCLISPPPDGDGLYHFRNGSVYTPPPSPLSQKGAHTEEDRKPNCINAWPLRTQPSSNPKRSQPRFSAAV